MDRDLEANLSAICKAPRKCRLELRQYVHRPRLERLEYVPVKATHLSSTAGADDISGSATSKLDETIRKTENKILHLVEELGYWAALTFAKDLVTMLEGRVKYESTSPFMPSVRQRALLIERLRPLVRRLTNIHADRLRMHAGQMHIPDKAKCFLDRLNEMVEQRGTAFLGIVFIRQRVAAAMLQKLLLCL